jgi:hypothetical protein
MTTAPPETPAPATLAVPHEDEVIDDAPVVTRRRRRARRRGLRRRVERLWSDVRGVVPVAGTRLARRRAERRRRRMRNGLLLFVAVVLAVPITHALSSRNHRAASRATPSRAADAAAGPRLATTMVLAHRSGNGDADLIVSLGLTGRRSVALLVPSSTLLEVPSFEITAVGAALRLGGPNLLRTSLSNALALDVGPVLTVDDASLAGLLAPVGSLNVRGGDVAVGGSPTQDRAFAPDDAARALVTRNDAGELDHFVLVGEILDAWFGALRAPGAVDATLAALPGASGDDVAPPALVANALRQIARSAPTVRTAAVEAAGGGSEAYRLLPRRLPEALRQAYAGRFLGDRRPQVEILNGTGEVGLAQRVSARLVPAGMEIVLTNNAPHFDVPKSLVLVYDRKQMAAGRSVLRALGVGEIRFDRKRVTVADVTVVVGADYQ